LNTGANGDLAEGQMANLNSHSSLHLDSHFNDEGATAELKADRMTIQNTTWLSVSIHM